MLCCCNYAGTATKWKRETLSRRRISPKSMSPKLFHNSSSSDAFHTGMYTFQIWLIPTNSVRILCSLQHSSRSSRRSRSTLISNGTRSRPNEPCSIRFPHSADCWYDNSWQLNRRNSSCSWGSSGMYSPSFTGACILPAIEAVPRGKPVSDTRK